MNKILLLSALVVSLSLMSCAGSKNKNPAQQETLQKSGISMSIAHELAKIDTLLRADTPNTVAAHESFLRALDMIEAGKFNFAELFYKRALANDPESNFLLSELIRILIMQNKKDEAFPLIKLNVITGNAKSGDYFTLARIYREKGKLDSSMFYYKKTADMNEENLSFLFEYSQMLEFTKNYQELKRVYDIMLPKLSYNPQLLDKQLLIYQMTQTPDSVTAALLGNAFAENGIAYVEYGIAQAELLGRLKKYNEANEVLMTIFFMHSSQELTAKLALRISDNYEKMNNITEAVAWLEQLLKKEPENHEAMNNLGYMLIEHDMDVKRGMTLVEKALTHKPKEFSYLDSQAWGFYKLGKFEEALKIFESLEPQGIEFEKKGIDVSELWEHLEKTCKALKLEDRAKVYKEKQNKAQPPQKPDETVK